MDPIDPLDEMMRRLDAASERHKREWADIKSKFTPHDEALSQRIRLIERKAIAVRDEWKRRRESENTPPAPTA